jgi:type I restriction enzyme S subunit
MRTVSLSLKLSSKIINQSNLGAFKGELVEQLSTDGDAKVLLEEIKKLREESNLL